MRWKVLRNHCRGYLELHIGILLRYHRLDGIESTAWLIHYAHRAASGTEPRQVALDSIEIVDEIRVVVVIAGASHRLTLVHL